MDTKKSAVVLGGAAVLLLAVALLTSPRSVSVELRGLGAPQLNVNPPSVYVQAPGAPNVTVTQPGLSADQTFGAFSFSRQFSAQTNLITASTTPASLYNGDGDDRIILSAYVFFYDSSGTYSVQGARSLDVATSTGAYTTGTAATMNATALFRDTITSSTAFQAYSTSTFTVPVARLWRQGEYLNVKLGAITSSTGQFVVQYVKATSTVQN